jgi:hypothetical protein
MSSKEYIDVTPTFREILPALLAMVENPVTRPDALTELSNMARLADERMAQLRNN